MLVAAIRAESGFENGVSLAFKRWADLLQKLLLRFRNFPRSLAFFTGFHGLILTENGEMC